MRLVFQTFKCTKNRTKICMRLCHRPGFAAQPSNTKARKSEFIVNSFLAKQEQFHNTGLLDNLGIATQSGDFYTICELLDNLGCTIKDGKLDEASSSPSSMPIFGLEGFTFYR